jgi:hypothetical protein
MEGSESFSRCGFGLKQCSADNPCPLHDKYLAIREGLYELAKSETILSLCRKVMDGGAVLNSLK